MGFYFLDPKTSHLVSAMLHVIGYCIIIVVMNILYISIIYLSLEHLNKYLDEK
jgi:hypothetical protein